MYSIELNGHAVGEAFYNGELENELRRINRTDYRFFLNSDRENCMEMVEKNCRDNIYTHTIPPTALKSTKSEVGVSALHPYLE